MRSPTLALLWEIGRRRQWTVGGILGLTIAGRVVDGLDTARGTGSDGADPSPLATLLGMVAFTLLCAVVNYTESSDGHGVGRFPRRLFALPVTTLRLVSAPLLGGITAVELLYLLWRGPLFRHGSASPAFVALLLGAFVVFYLAVLWTLERAGALRLLVAGIIANVFFVIGILPSFPPTPPPPWRSEAAIAGLVATLAIVAFLWMWHHVARLRAGGGGARRADRAAHLFGWRLAPPIRRRAFASPAAAQFWFEWRSSGMALPALVGGLVLVVILPMSWLTRSDPANALRLLLVTLSTPVALAVPVGIAFSKPTPWSEDVALPAFVAVRPVSSEELVATKVQVAMASALLSWAMVLVFLAVWLSSWANLDSISQLAIQLWAFHGQSVGAVYGIAALVSITGMFLTWRSLVSRLWSGLSGMRPLIVGAVVWIVVVVIASLVFDASRLPGWLLDDPVRLAPVAWVAGLAVITKYWLAAYAWRGVAPRYLRVYLTIWLAGTVSCVALGLVLCRIARIYVPLDVDRSRSLVILLALSAMPLARVGLAPSWLARNRHRSS